MRLALVDDIIVNRDERQRRRVEVEDLVASIQQNEQYLPETLGLINPICVRGGNVLVAGERRLTAFKVMGKPQIPVIDIEQLPETEAKILELEENLKRVDLTWQERCRAAADIHRRLEEKDPEWNQSKTAER